MSKEWSGNSKSVRVMNGCSNNVDRAAGDYYTTDPAAVEEFLDALGWWKLHPEKKGMVVWEPACGCGNISEVLKRRFGKVYSTDLFDRGYEKMDKQIDFLKAPLIDPNCEVIITNPPYSLCDEFILHALDILPMGGVVMMLLNINYLAGQSRFKKIYSHKQLDTVFIYTHRINCYKNNMNTGHSSPVNYGWFIFQKGGSKTPRIEWITKKISSDYVPNT